MYLSVKDVKIAQVPCLKVKWSTPWRSWLLWRKRGGEFTESAINKLTLASTPVSVEQASPFYPHSLRQIFRPFANKKITATSVVPHYSDGDAINKPRLQQRSLETANLNITYRWRRKTNTQPRNTRH
jgi:hypothetical protein